MRDEAPNIVSCQTHPPPPTACHPTPPTRPPPPNTQHPTPNTHHSTSPPATSHHPLSPPPLGTRRAWRLTMTLIGGTTYRPKLATRVSAQLRLTPSRPHGLAVSVQCACTVRTAHADRHADRERVHACASAPLLFAHVHTRARANSCASHNLPHPTCRTRSAAPTQAKARRIRSGGQCSRSRSRRWRPRYSDRAPSQAWPRPRPPWSLPARPQLARPRPRPGAPSRPHPRSRPRVDVRTRAGARRRKPPCRARHRRHRCVKCSRQ